MNQENVLNDLSTLIKIPNKTLGELFEKMNLCIGSIVYEAKANNEHTVQINVGFGTLSIDLVDMNCKFIPSKNLKAAIKKGLTAKIDPVELAVESALADKLIALCAEVM